MSYCILLYAVGMPGRMSLVSPGVTCPVVVTLSARPSGGGAGAVLVLRRRPRGDLQPPGDARAAHGRLGEGAQHRLPTAGRLQGQGRHEMHQVCVHVLFTLVLPRLFADISVDRFVGFGALQSLQAQLRKQCIAMNAD